MYAGARYRNITLFCNLLSSNHALFEEVKCELLYEYMIWNRLLLHITKTYFSSTFGEYSYESLLNDSNSVRSTMKSVNITGLMLGMLAVGGLIAGGALMTGQAFALTIQTANVGQANSNTQTTPQDALAIACQANSLLASSAFCANIGEEEPTT